MLCIHGAYLTFFMGRLNKFLSGFDKIESFIDE